MRNSSLPSTDFQPRSPATESRRTTRIKTVNGLSHVERHNWKNMVLHCVKRTPTSRKCVAVE